MPSDDYWTRQEMPIDVGQYQDPIPDLPQRRRVGFDPETQPNLGSAGETLLPSIPDFWDKLRSGKVKIWTILAIAAVIAFFMGK